MTSGNGDDSVDLSRLLERKPLAEIQLRVLVLATLAILLEGFDIQLVAFAAPSILKDWSLTKSTLGVVMAAALVGMAAGGVGGGYLGDRFGRRVTLIGSTLCFAAATLAGSLARDATQLTVLRIIAGMGFGAALPSATALVAEYMPARIRAQSVALVVIGVPCGAMCGAALASWLIPTYGWRSVFVVGGSLPILLAMAMLIALPESLRFMLRSGQYHERLARLVRRIDGRQRDASTRFTLAKESHEPGHFKRAPGTIFTAEFARSTAGIWIACFASLACAYAFFSWIPTVLSTLGYPVDVAIQGSFYFNLFGVIGALGGSWLVTNIGSRAAMLSLLSLGIAATFVLGSWLLFVATTKPPIRSELIMVALSCAGASNAGVQAALYALAAHIYPTHCRATGIGWAATVGRVAAIGSAYGGGVVLALAGGPGVFFITLGVLLVVAAIGTVIVDRHSTR